MKSRFSYLSLLIIFAGLLAACGPSAEEIAATAQAQQNQEATATAAALPTQTSTPTPTSTATATPTATITPTPIPTSALVPDIEVVTYVDFDYLPGSWFSAPNVHLKDGIASLDPSETWDGIFTESNLSAGQTVLITYKFAPNTVTQLAVETGEFGTESYRSWGFSNGFGYARPLAQDGQRGYPVDWRTNYVSFVADQWYGVALYIGSTDEDFRIRLWALDDPSTVQEQSYSLTVTGSPRWNSKITNGPKGSSMIDRWEVIEGWPWGDE